MNFLTYYHYLRLLRIRLGLSEQALAEKARISRLTVRQMENGAGNPTLHSLSAVAKALDQELLVTLIPNKRCASDYSTVAVSLKVVQDGFDLWKTHFLEYVDEFRKTSDCRLILLPPVNELPFKLKAMLASITVGLCEESGMEIPAWAYKRYFLDEPWFPSESDSLKAMAIRDSPLAFRNNNIFVQGNFMERA